MLMEVEQEVVKIRQNLKAAQDRQKSYADKHRVNRVLALRMYPGCKRYTSR